MQFKGFFLAGMGLLAVPAVMASGTHWGYSGHKGPEHWGELQQEFASCKSGTRQSPIDIKMDVLVPATMNNIQFHYQPVSPELINNGHTIQANYASGSGIDVDGRHFGLVQFHFHTPSENTVDGKPYDMEMHLVHKNKQGELAVVGVFFKKGAANAVLEKLWAHMPEKAGEKQMLSGVSLSAADLLPANHSYAHFNGSLTTPPCSEGVNWFVLKEPLQASKQQIAKFAKVIGNNARPVQDLNNRFVLTKN